METQKGLNRLTAHNRFLDRLALASQIAQDSIADGLRDVGDGPVPSAMRYAVRGGKGLRAFLVIESAALFGISSTKACPAAGAIEALHAYSLVHDDLPAMDDDDLRRGEPTVHKAWDEATAILAGDALQSFAFDLLTRLDVSDETRLKLIAGLAHAAGVRGMVGGQALDIAAETATAPLTLEEITRLQDGKTGALFVWSATAGAHLAGADPRPLETFARDFGLAFQIADDILDATGNEATAGKRLHKDADAGKATFVSLLGLEAAQSKAGDLIDAAKTALDGYGDRADTLRAAADFVISRDR